MSLSYHGTQRPSWSRDYSSSSSSASSRPLTVAGSSSIRSRATYGSATSTYDTLDRRSYTSNKTDISSVPRRLPVYTATTRKLDEPVNRLSSHSGGLSHGVTADRIGRRDSYTDLSPTAGVDIGSSYYQRVRSHPENSVNPPDGSGVTGDGCLTSPSANVHRRTDKYESIQRGASSSVDPDHITRRRERRSQQEKLSSFVSTEDLNVSNERKLSLRSLRHRHRDVDNIDDSAGREKTSSAETRLQEHRAVEEEVSVQRVNTRDKVGAAKTTNIEISETDGSQRTGALYGDSLLGVDVEHGAHPEQENAPFSTSRGSARGSDHTSAETSRGSAPSSKPHADCSERSLYTKNTSFAKKYLAPEISEYILSKSYKKEDNVEVANDCTDIHCEGKKL